MWSYPVKRGETVKWEVGLEVSRREARLDIGENQSLFIPLPQLSMLITNLKWAENILSGLEKEDQK